VHVLTKVFIVLVSLLSVLLVPLVVVYSHNEDSYKAKFQAAEAQAAIARDALQTAESRHGAVVNGLTAKVQQLENDMADVVQEKTNLQVDLRELESKLVAAESLQTEIFGKLSVLVSANEAGQLILGSLLSETRNLRNDSVHLREQNNELDTALADTQGQLDVAVAARRALLEENQRLKEERGEAIAKIASYVASYGDIEPVALGGLQPDVNIDAAIIAVSRSADGTYAEIDAGSRDGVKEGWMLTIYSGGKFIGNLRIERVDINRATGIVMLEDESRAGLVQVGHRASARAGG